MPSNDPITDEQPRTRVQLPDDPYGIPLARRTHWLAGISALAVVALLITALVLTSRNGAHRSGAGPSAGTGGASGGTAGATGLAGSAVSPGTGGTAAPATGGSEPAAAQTPEPASGLPPTDRSVLGVPVGYPHTRSGAESAATNYAVAYGSAAMFQRGARHRIIRAIADPDQLSTLQAQLDTSFASLTTAFGLDAAGDAPRGQVFVYRTLPVGTYLASYHGDTASVEVWTNGLVGLAGGSTSKPVVEAWNTVTVNLRWTDGDWRWVSFSQRDGPTPVSGVQAVSSADEIAAAAKKFGGLRYAR